jgi:tRNA A-37 threonylcarbamoyl transferase component Bud32
MQGLFCAALLFGLLLSGAGYAAPTSLDPDSHLTSLVSRLVATPCFYDGDSVLADITGDGLLDLLIAGHVSVCGGFCTFQVLLYQNRIGQQWVDVSSTWIPVSSTNLANVSLAVLDKDGDGRLDVLIFGGSTASLGEARALLLHNNGSALVDVSAASGALQTALPLGLYDGDAVVFDADADGDNDVFLFGRVQNTSAAVVLLRNDGGLAFSDASASLSFPALPGVTGIYGAQAAVADIDGNGYLDVFVSGETLLSIGQTPPLFVLLLGNASGYVDAASVMMPLTSTVLGPAPWGLARSSAHFVDFDKDIDLDIVLNGLRINATTGDLIGPTIMVLRNPGNGSAFSDVSASIFGYMVQPSFFGSVASVDYDNDGYPEIIASGVFSTTLGGVAAAVFRFNSTSQLMEDAYSPLFGSQAIAAGRGRTIITGDTSGDGYRDIIALGWRVNTFVAGDGLLSYLKSSPGDRFEDLTTTTLPLIDAKEFSATLSVGDLDSDGCLDFIVGGRIGTDLSERLVFGDCAGGIRGSPQQTGKGTIFGRTILFDPDNDGDLDYFGAGLQSLFPPIGVAYFFRNTGGGTLIEIPVADVFLDFPVDLGEPDMDAADFNQDGFIDFVISGMLYNDSFTGTTFSIVAVGLGNGTFQQLGPSGFIGARPEGMEYGTSRFVDLNDDGRKDLFVVGCKKPVVPFSGLFVSLLGLDITLLQFVLFIGENLGNNSFADRTVVWYPATSSVMIFTGAVVVDVTRDGRPDILQTGFPVPYLSVIPPQLLVSTANGSLIDGTPHLGVKDTMPSFVATIAVGDLDGDGLLEIFLDGLYRLGVNDYQPKLASILTQLANFTGNPSQSGPWFEDISSISNIRSGVSAGVIANFIRNDSKDELLLAGPSACPVSYFYIGSRASSTGNSNTGNSDSSSSLSASAIGAIAGGAAFFALAALCACALISILCFVIFAVLVTICLVIIIATVVIAIVALVVVAGGGAGLAVGAIVRGRGKGDKEPLALTAAAAEEAELAKEALDPEAVVKRMRNTELKLIDLAEIEFGPLIGAGSYGSVFRGNWRGVEVAIKVLLSKNITRAQLEEFEREALINAKLSHHPRILTLYGAVVSPEKLCLVTRFCANGSLDHYIERHPDLSDLTKLQVATACASGLAFLHENGMVHRDVAARNVLIGSSIHFVFLCDFGYSRVFEGSSVEHHTKSDIGPVRWMAPESMREKVYTHASDAYAFGMLMYELFTGKVPFYERHSLADVALAVTSQHEQPTIPATLPAAVASLMHQLWDFDPASRPTMESVRQQLQHEVDEMQSEGPVDIETANAAGSRADDVASNYGILSDNSPTPAYDAVGDADDRDDEDEDDEDEDEEEEGDDEEEEREGGGVVYAAHF